MAQGMHRASRSLPLESCRGQEGREGGRKSLTPKHVMREFAIDRSIDRSEVSKT